MTLLEMATRVQDLASGPQILDAVDQFYADDVTIVEGSGESFTGKQTQKDRILDWQKNLKAVHGDGTMTLAVDETAPGTGVVFIETASDIEFHEGGRVMFEEVAVQRWADGKIVHERFYYHMPGA